MPCLMSLSCFEPDEVIRILQSLGAHAANDNSCFYHQLFKDFGFPDADFLPIAAMSATADGLPLGNYLRADPVVLQVDWAHVYMLGNDYLSLKSEEIHALVKLLKEYLASENLELHAPHPRRWYIKLNSNLELITHDPKMILGKSIIHYLPRGSTESYWKRLFNELQMLLFESEVNKIRNDQNESTVDALWFWGAGSLPPEKQKSRYVQVKTNDAVAAGLAKFTQTSLSYIDRTQKNAWSEATHRQQNDLVCLRFVQELDEPEQFLQDVTECASVLKAQQEPVIIYINSQCYRI